MIETKSKGFTLIELLIVVAIIAILAAIAIPNFLEAQMRAKVVKTVADMRTAAQGLELYQTDHNQYPMGTGTEYYGVGGEKLSWMIDFMLVEKDTRTHMGNLITSPIAYLSNFPYDYFNTRQLRKSGGFYRGGRQVSYVFSGIPRGGSNPGFDNQYLKTYTDFLYFGWTWFMESAGPDLVWWQSSRPNPSEDWQTFFYDPTNGTISQGQIVYYEGGVTFPKL